MRIPGLKALVGLARPLLSTLSPGALILGYHRVSELSWDPLNLSVSPDNFSDQLATLSAHYEVVFVRRLAERIERGKSVVGMAALTFDDGYAEFLDSVLPRLEEHNVPATLFVPSGLVGTQYWWDQVAAAFDPRLQRHSPVLVQWQGGARYRGDTRPSTAADLARTVCLELEHVGPTERAQALTQCRDHLVKHDVSQRATSLGAQQLVALAKHPLVEVGGHGANHVRLDELDAERQRVELEKSKRELEAIIGAASVVGMSYPHGASTDDTGPVAAAAGYRFACASHAGLVRADSDRYRLPRAWPPNASVGEFRAWLRAWRGLL